MDMIDTRQKIIAGFFILAIIVLVWQIYMLLGNNSPPDHITKRNKNDYTVQLVAKPFVRRMGDIQKGVVK